MLHRTGFRFTFLFGATGLSVGSWLRYAGARTKGPSYALTIVGQVVMGIAGAVPISLPSHYTNLWFDGNSRIAANAIMSLSYPTGGAVCVEHSFLCNVPPFWMEANIFKDRTDHRPHSREDKAGHPDLDAVYLYYS